MKMLTEEHKTAIQNLLKTRRATNGYADFGDLLQLIGADDVFSAESAALDEYLDQLFMADKIAISAPIGDEARRYRWLA
jgi:hypothetical protein